MMMFLSAGLADKDVLKVLIYFQIWKPTKLNKLSQYLCVKVLKYSTFSKIALIDRIQNSEDWNWKPL